MLPTPKRVKRSAQAVDDSVTDEDGWETPLGNPGGLPEDYRGVPPRIIGDIKEEPSSLHQEDNTTSPAVRWRERPVTPASPVKASLPEPKRLSSPADVMPPRERTREGVSLGSPPLIR